MYPYYWVHHESRWLENAFGILGLALIVLFKPLKVRNAFQIVV